MKRRNLLSLLLALGLVSGCAQALQEEDRSIQLDTGTETDWLLESEAQAPLVSSEDVPAYEGQGIIELENNVPSFEVEEVTETAFMEFGDLDELGRCTYAIMCAGPETLPQEKRGDISKIKPTGWKQNYYTFVEQEALYNRSHLLAYSLSGQNANEQNLITGTRYMNAALMEPYESSIADYIKETGNHVMYEVIPDFDEDNLLASGVEMQAYSVEDDGEGISFHIYCYNVQPGVDIDYATGENEEAEDDDPKENFILNTYKRVYHSPECVNAAKISSRNYQEYYGCEEILLEQGYQPASDCLIH